MSKPFAPLARTLALTGTLALLTGCNTSTPQQDTATPQQNEPQVCAAAKAYASALTSFKDTLTPSATVEQVRTAMDQVVKTYDDLNKASEAVAKDRVDAVMAAEDKFVSAVKDVPDDANLAQARDSLRDEAANVQAALSDLGTAAKC